MRLLAISRRCAQKSDTTNFRFRFQNRRGTAAAVFVCRKRNERAYSDLMLRPERENFISETTLEQQAVALVKEYFDEWEEHRELTPRGKELEEAFYALVADLSEEKKKSVRMALGKAGYSDAGLEVEKALLTA